MITAWINISDIDEAEKTPRNRIETISQAETIRVSVTNRGDEKRFDRGHLYD